MTAGVPLCPQRRGGSLAGSDVKGERAARLAPWRPLRYHLRSISHCINADMMELNPVRQRITDLTDRVVSLRGYL